jgi:DNA-binding LytR/AlgR family response regulator
MNDPMPGASPSCLYFRVDRKKVKVFLDEILYIEGFSDYIKINTGKKTIVTKHLLSALEETLPRENLIRIHRSYIVSASKIASYHADVIHMGNRELPIGRLYKQKVIKRLQFNPNLPSNENK